MSQILVLTKNTLNEESFERKILQLGHETFISSVIIDECLMDRLNIRFFEMFQFIVLSETIDNSEAIQIVKKMSRFSIKILRKSDEQLDDHQMQKWIDQGIDDWIERDPRVEVLREKLSCKKTIKEGNVVLLQKSIERRPLSSLSLSGGELKLFIILYQQKEKIVSREELCLRMWNRKKCNSTMSQLSVLVKNLKNKLAMQNIDGPIIKTCWGQGYRMDESVYDQVRLDSQELQLAHK
ncbi:helix-turn-helix domain-containing protein [Enterococcus sp. AZ196]|uniref:helix-turn-helix domain-containing protein n=1 Tax=Enterococcus sp. AZ196 TaxID=2774659 RepID=UPI003D28DC7C